MKETQDKHFKRVSTDLTKQSHDWLTGKAQERGVTVAEFLRLLVDVERVNDGEYVAAAKVYVAMAQADALERIAAELERGG